MKKTNFLIASLIGTSLLAGCSKDYSDQFTYLSTEPVGATNTVVSEYEIKNTNPNETLTYEIDVNGSTETYKLEPGDKETVEITSVIDQPESHDIKLPVTLSVLEDGKEIWSKEDTIDFDAEDMLTHDVTITYKDQSVTVKAEDFKKNVYNLTELFKDYNPDEKLVVERDLQAALTNNEDATEVTPKNTPASGKYLVLIPQDDYLFTDGEIKLVSGELADQVDWSKQIKIRETGTLNHSTVMGMKVSTITLYVDITNPSIQNVYVNYTDILANDSSIDPYYTHEGYFQSIAPGESDEISVVTSGPVLQSSGQTDIRKIGIRVVVRADSKDGKELFNDVVWIDLN